MIGKLKDGVAGGVGSLSAVARSGLLKPERPDKLVRMAAELHRRGPLAAACSTAAIRYGDRPALIDELGTLSYRELDERSNAIARAWIADGIRSGGSIAILCRNHRGFVDATFAAAKVGLRIILMNTEFAGPQLADVCEREGARTLVYDEEYADRVPRLQRRFVAWSEDGAAGGRDPALEQLIADNSADPVDAPSTHPAIVLLTSGTTGAPKGAPRPEGGSLSAAGGLLERLPFRSGEATYVAPPFFHALGFANLMLAFPYGSTVVTRRRFSPEAMLEGVDRHACSALIVVPPMLQRAFELDSAVLAGYACSGVRLIVCSGSQLPGPTATAVLEKFGDVLHVLYGSTEISYVTISVPEDHRAAPATVGRPVRGVTVKLLDDDGREVPPGETGRIFAASGMEFGGYTDGHNKEIIDGLMSSGDVGHFDSEGRLFIDGRDDEMIVSGGENVFPQEVEELLNGHPGIAEVAVIGMEDDDFGQRLAAYVVPVEGAAPTEDAVRAFVKQNLARYKVPRDVHLLDELPRNATGKILKRKLAETAA